MNPNIDTTDFTEKQKVIFLTTSVKSMAKILKRLSNRLHELEEENQELTKKYENNKIYLERLGKKNAELRRANRKLKK